MNAALIIVNANNIIVKTLEDKRIFVNAILDPSAPNLKLKKAQSNYQNFISNAGNKNSTSGEKSWIEIVSNVVMSC